MKAQPRNEIKAELTKTFQHLMCNNDISDDKFISLLNEGLCRVDEALTAWKGAGILLRRKA